MHSSIKKKVVKWEDAQEWKGDSKRNIDGKIATLRMGFREQTSNYCSADSLWQASKKFFDTYENKLRKSLELKNSLIRQEFEFLAKNWYKDIQFTSDLQQIVLHPAYQRIIGMGKPALPYIFQELKMTSGHWLWALFAITGEDAAKPEHTYKQAVVAWLNWGEIHGYN